MRLLLRAQSRLHGMCTLVKESLQCSYPIDRIPIFYSGAGMTTNIVRDYLLSVLEKVDRVSLPQV